MPDKIDKLRPSVILGSREYSIIQVAKKVNELVDKINALMIEVERLSKVENEW